jgi:small multidrug resistance pump
MNVIPLNIAYAIWSGLGTVLTALIAILIWKEPVNIFTGVGIVLIISGVVLLDLKGPAH